MQRRISRYLLRYNGCIGKTGNRDREQGMSVTLAIIFVTLGVRVFVDWQVPQS